MIILLTLITLSLDTVSELKGFKIFGTGVAIESGGGYFVLSSPPPPNKLLSDCVQGFL